MNRTQRHFLTRLTARLPGRHFSRPAPALVLAAALCMLSGAHAQSTVPAQVAAPAASGEALLSTLVSLLQTLVDQGVLTAAKAQEMLRQAGVDPGLLVTAAPPPGPATPVPPVVRVPYVPQVVKDELRENLKQDVINQAREEHWAEPGSLPSWLSRLSWYGDVRFRIERESYSGSNDTTLAIDNYYQLPAGTTLTTTDTRNRPRVRARLGVSANLDENFKANVMVATATGDDATASPVSFNADQGRYGRPFSAAIDVAYLQWLPLPSLQVTGGRVTNPYLSSTIPFLASDLVWWPDLAFDGALVRFAPLLTRHWSAYATAGAHPLQTSQLGPYNTAPQQWLYAGQAGAQFKSGDDSSVRVGLSYFSYVGLQGTLNPANPPLNTFNALTQPLFRQRGNTMFDINTLSNPGTAAYAYAGQFKEFEFDINGELATFDPLRIAADLDFVRNVGFNTSEIASHIGAAAAALPLDRNGKTGIQRPRVEGYQLRLLAGRHEVVRLGDWQTFVGYRYLQRDAVVDAFTAPDYHLGGTDQRGPFLGVNFGVANNTSVILRYSTTKPIDAVPKFEINEWFLDFLGRF